MLDKLIKERLSLFKDRSFLSMCCSGLLSTFGNGLVYVTTSWFAYEYFHSIAGVAWMMFLLWTPGIIFSPIFGVCADKFNKKYIILMSNLARGVAIIVFAAALINQMNISIFYLAGILGVFVSFYMPAAVPLITQIVPKEHFVKANATIDMIYELGVVSGMGLSGVFIHYFGMLSTLLLGGVFFCLSALTAGCIRYSEKQKETKSSDNKRSIIKNYVDSLRYLKQSRILIEVLFIQAFIMIILMTLPITLVPYVKETLKAGTGIFAAFESLYSLGILIGCCMINYLHARYRFVRLFATQMIIMASSLLIMAISYNLWLSMWAYLICGWCLSSWALSLSQTQSLTDIQYQGRLQALSNSVSGVFILVIYLMVTLKSQWIEIPWLYLMESLAAFLMGIAVLFFQLNTQNKKDQTELEVVL